MRCPYPGLVAGTVRVIVPLAPGSAGDRQGVVGEDSQAVMVQQVIVALLDRDDPGHIANHSMVVVVVLVTPVVEGVVVALRFPMSCSMC